MVKLRARGDFGVSSLDDTHLVQDGVGELVGRGRATEVARAEFAVVTRVSMVIDGNRTKEIESTYPSEITAYTEREMRLA